MRLFSYCIPVDDGAAPNPYFSTCTLTICKPVIRRVAEVGDWIAGVGSKSVNGIDYSGKLIYAMKVTRKLKLADYDYLCQSELIGKIPDVNHTDYNRRVGDCIYDFHNNTKGKLRPSVHGLGNKKTDLGGINALMSTHFFYFGNSPIEIPSHLKGMIKQGQGHRSTSNDYLKLEFVNWIENAGYQFNSINGDPQVKIAFNNSVDDEYETESCRVRCQAAEEDEVLLESDI